MADVGMKKIAKSRTRNVVFSESCEVAISILRTARIVLTVS
jgi:hypothetical protein